MLLYHICFTFKKEIFIQCCENMKECPLPYFVKSLPIASLSECSLERIHLIEINGVIISFRLLSRFDFNFKHYKVHLDSVIH